MEPETPVSKLGRAFSNSCDFSSDDDGQAKLKSTDDMVVDSSSNESSMTSNHGQEAGMQMEEESAKRAFLSEFARLRSPKTGHTDNANKRASAGAARAQMRLVRQQQAIRPSQLDLRCEKLEHCLYTRIWTIACSNFSFFQIPQALVAKPSIISICFGSGMVLIFNESPAYVALCLSRS